MFIFQSKFRNLNVGLIAEFRNFEFRTDDPNRAKKLRKAGGFGTDYWEFPNGSPEPPKAVETVRGARTSEIMEKQQ